MERSPKDGNGRIRDHLTSVWRQTGRKPKALETPDAPPHLYYLWGHYCAIKRGQSLTWQELDAWSRMTATPLRAWESETIMRIESAVNRALKDDDHR